MIRSISANGKLLPNKLITLETKQQKYYQNTKKFQVRDYTRIGKRQFIAHRIYMSFCVLKFCDIDVEYTHS